MKLLVEIPDYRYKSIKKIDVAQKPYTINERSAIIVIKNGQPLPEDQESVLDKIRAEIEALEEGITSYHNDRPWIFKDEVLEIIDKYKAESEG